MKNGNVQIWLRGLFCCRARSYYVTPTSRTSIWCVAPCPGASFS